MAPARSPTTAGSCTMLHRSFPSAAKAVGPWFGTLLFMIAIGACIDPAEGRAVNISNSWTLPQEGFSVFYRYFRDKISWFEADAVCQFHHAILAMVDNGVQFDATRAFLKELDVTSAVWIGLMRPENTGRFTWTSSKALDPGGSGYWAEALPAMEQPLCAVVDPTRDFRWHALRCGGPETAAFLCELPVPSWAADCTITSIPSLTVQYMSDSGTVQLARDCGESGTKHISCQGKQDRESILQQLQCSETEDLTSVLAPTDNNNNRNNSNNSNRLVAAVNGAVTTAINATSASSSMTALQPILEHDILTVVSSNDDDISSSGSSTGSSSISSTSGSSIDSIVINSNQIEDTVKNVIKKFNLQGLLESERTAIHTGDELGSSGDDETGGGGGGAATSGPRKVYGYAKKYSPLYEKKPHYAKKAVLGLGDGLDMTEELDEEEAREEQEEEEERMMGDQPPPLLLMDETETQPIDIIQEAVKPTADGDYPLGGPTQHSSATPVLLLSSSSSSSSPSTSEVPPVEFLTTMADSRLRRVTDPGEASDDATPAVTATTPLATTTTTTTTVAPVTPTTAASHILPTTSRKEVITGDHFIPPMLLVKARFISARPHTEPPPTTMATPRKAIGTVQTPLASSEALPTLDLSLLTSRSTEAAASVPPPTTSDLPPGNGDTGTTGSSATSSSDSNDIQHAHSSGTVASESVTLLSPTWVSSVASNGTIVTVPVGHDIDTSTPTPDPEEGDSSSLAAAAVKQEEQSASVPSEATNGHPEPAEEELDGEGETMGDDHDEEHTTELHNSFSNVENYQPYKPNRHRALTKAEQHHNHGNYIKKILG